MRAATLCLAFALLVVPTAAAAPPDPPESLDELGQTIADCATMVAQPSEDPADLVLGAAMFAVCVVTS